MRKLLLVTLALVATGCAISPAPESALDAPSASGRMLVERHCASCHAIGRNDRSRHPDAPAFRTLSQSYPISALEESLSEGIMVGHPDMPEFKFSSADVEAIVSYLQSIQSQ